MSMPMPRRKTPDLAVSIVDGGAWTLSAQTPQNFTLIAAYRGLHCPICKAYLADLNRKIDDFATRGVTAIAVSTDSEERARQARDEWGLDKVPVGYGMTIEAARAWGLFISTSRGKTSLGIEEPAVFAEPGLFLVRPDGTLYASAIQSMPFARPHFADVMGALDFIIAKDYPARGEA